MRNDPLLKIVSCQITRVIHRPTNHYYDVCMFSSVPQPLCGPWKAQQAMKPCALKRASWHDFVPNLLKRLAASETKTRQNLFVALQNIRITISL